ncbi:fibronectin type III domain-containing protein [Streptomyces tanashiensis]|uniref:Cellulose 1,4-beta-cellobiosidase n=1 Tax=Streptomyces tanashiensis TaxID=67367 RepID=A0ABY6R0N4_9ACTN|nr:PA14 domain-containing protein [Streptomyces tanashiensis]UZX23041.1 cellulose 1,4-beta-cellobiosidase [Streptomyces tanashiensis]
MTTRTRLSALATTAALAASGGLLTATPAAAAVTCTSPVWKAEYFANSTFSGTPKLTSCDSAIAENYGSGDPAGGRLPKDNFSVRWSVTRDFGSGGPFTFTAEAQDGIRVHLDGVRRIDLWKNVTTTQRKTVSLTVPAGKHTITVYYAAWTGAANVKFAYTPVTSATADKVRPLAPAGATVAYDKTLGKATLKWAANKEMDLAGYRLYRRLSTSTTWTKVSSATALITGTSYVNSPPPTGQTHLYELRAVDKAGNESPGGADLTVVSVDRTPTAAPAGVAASDGYTGVVLAWQPVTGAATYTVHRQRTGTTDPVAQVATGVTATTWKDTTATERTGYTYWVSAVDAAGNTSARTAVTATRGDYAPGAPTGLTAVDTGSHIRGFALRWTAPADTDVASYRVYRNGSLLGTASSPSYTDENGLWHGTTYRYTVTAVDRAGHESPASAEAVVTTEGDLIAPAPVTGLRATPREDGVLVEWDASTEPDLKRYEVYRAEKYDDGDGGTVWLAHRVEYLSTTATSFLHPSEADGENVMYTLIAVDQWENMLRADDPSLNWAEVTELGTPVTP